MHVRLDAKTALALVRVRNDEALVGLLKAEAEATKDSLVHTRDEAAIHRAQGKAEFLLELLAEIEKSSQTALKLGA